MRSMPATNRQQKNAETRLRDEAALIAWRQCLEENGLQGAIGCAHLAHEAADAFIEQRRKRTVRNG
jgi:hypothetical protein